MWFLQIDIMGLMLALTAAGALVFAAAGRLGKRQAAMELMPLLDLLLLWYVSEKLTVFYVGYVLVTYGFLLLLRRVVRFRKFWFVALCLGCLVPFLYFRAVDFYPSLPTMGLVLVGVSYNMLKAIDALYYEYYAGEKIPFRMYANFILFFPVLTAGPIFRYRDFDRTWHNPVPLTAARLTWAVQRMIRGMFKKVVVQALVYQLMTWLLQFSPHLAVSAAVTVLSYLILYLDMSGYADVAIAMGGILGLTVPENFKNPLTAPSFTQFWRTWHVTLSDWIREHIFVVLNGKRLNRWQGALIGFVTMVVMSLWHDFGKLFLLGGCAAGLVLAAENLLEISTVNRRKVSKPYFTLRCLITNVIFAVNSLLFTVDVVQLKSLLRGFFTL